MPICTWVSRLLSSHTNTHIWIRIHKDINLSTKMLGYVIFHPLEPKATNLQLQTPTLFFSLRLFIINLYGKFFLLVGDFIARTSSHQGQDLHLDDSGINLLEVPRPHWLTESDNIGHYNAFGQILIENLYFSGFIIFNGVDKQCQNFTCFSNMGRTSIVDYLIGDPNSLHTFISNFSICDKQPNSSHYPLFFKLGHSIGWRLITLSSQGQVLRPNPKKANQYALNVKHELIFVQGKTCTSLDNHTQAWVHLILYAPQPIFFKNLGGKHRGRLSNTWFDNDCWEAWWNFHMLLNSSNSKITSTMAFKKYGMIVWYKKHSYM